MGCISSSTSVIELKNLSCIKSKDRNSNSSNQKLQDSNELNNLQKRKKINKVQFLNYSQSIDFTENITISTEQFTVKDKELLNEILSKNYIFHKLSTSERKQIIQKFMIYDSNYEGKIQTNTSNQNNDQYLFKKGDIGTMFFVIKSGNVEVQLDKIEQNGQKKTLSLSKGDSFGQLALLYKTPRTASIKCLTKCTFLCLSSNLFRQALQNIVERTIESSKILIERIKLFHYLGPKEKNKLANNVVMLKYEKDDIVFREGQDSLAFFVIVSGGVKIQIKNKPPLQLRPGDYFGESCFQQNSKRSGTVHCTQKTQLMTISKSAIQKVFGNQFHEFYFFSILKWTLKRNPILSLIPNKSVEKLLKESDIINFSNGHTILKKGEKIQKLYIPIEGKINNYQVGEIVNCQYLVDIQTKRKCPIINQSSLVKQSEGYVCVMDINRVLSVLQKQNIFVAQISSTEFQNLKKFISSKKQIQQAYKKSFKLSKSQELSAIRMQHLKIVQKISDGQFGPIYKVRNFIDNSLYVLKTFDKHQVDSYKMRNFVKNQVEVMQIAKQNDFIVQHHRNYQIQQYFLILMQLIDGKDFFDTISDIGKLNKEQIQFYFATFVLAIEFLHSNDIIYRDIKPQNAVLSSNGYLKVIDLGTARFLSQKNGYRSFTIIGTPHYMAPEVIAGKGYSFQADIWSLGVLLYELACGSFPYGKKLQQPIQIYDEIIKNGQSLKYPKNFTQESTKKLIQRLLIKQPTMRQMDNFNEIKQSQFYQGFDWDKFANKTMKAPCKVQKKQVNTPKINDKKKNAQETLMNYFDRKKFQTKKQNPKITFPNWNLF